LSPQAGHLFETLVYSEIIKAKQNLSLQYDVFFWRTKDQEEIDFVIEEQNRFTLIEVKLGSGSAHTFRTPEALGKLKSKVRKCVVTAAGERRKIDADTDCLPIWDLCKYLSQ
jgi:predicted AAA+ superfamily ATPase